MPVTIDGATLAIGEKRTLVLCKEGSVQPAHQMGLFRQGLVKLMRAFGIETDLVAADETQKTEPDKKTPKPQ